MPFVKRFFQARLFPRYLISYIIILIIPFVILSFIIYGLFTDILISNISKTNYDVLFQTMNTVETQFNEMNALVSQISMNPYLTSSRLKNDFINLLTAEKLLKSFSTLNDFYTDYVIFYEGHDYIYSATSIYQKEMLFKSVFRYDDWNLASLTRDIQKNQKAFIRPSEYISRETEPVKKRFVTYVVPLPYGNPVPYGAVVFFISEANFSKYVSVPLKTYDSSLFIIDENARLLFSYGVNKQTNLDNITKTHLNNSGYNFDLIKIGSVKYMLSSIKSETTGWNYVSLTPSAKMTGELESLKTKERSAISIVLVLGGLMIYLLSTINYKPIKDLTGFITRKLKLAQSGLNELDTIRNAVDSMNETIVNLNEKIESTVPVLRKSVLADLLKGYYSDIDSFNTNAAPLGLKLTGDFFTSVVFYINHFAHREKIYVLKSIEENLRNAGIQSYGVEGFIDNYLVFILCTKEEQNDKLLYMNLKNLQAYLKTVFDIDTAIGIGNSYSCTDGLSSSYIEAVSAVEYKLITGNATMTSYKDIQQIHQNINLLFKEQLDLLEIHLIQGDKSNVEELLKNIISSIATIQVPLFVAKTLFYNIINTLWKTARAHSIKPFCSIDDLNAILLSKNESLEKISSILLSASLNICSQIEEQKKGNIGMNIDAVVKYINNNLTDTNFSIQCVADHFHIALPNLSRYFKQRFSENISSYVNKLRMEIAKKLLLTTEDTLQDISLQVGYYNVSSFIRKFRQTEGVTPGIFREIKKQ